MTDRLHLKPQHRAILEGLLQAHLPDVEVWAYGSRINGRSHDGSDLDLVLRGPDLAEIPFDQLLDFEEALRESTIPFIVEAKDWARLPQKFRREIERKYVVIKRSMSHRDWPKVAIGEIADIFGGGTPSTKKTENFDGDIPWLTPKDLSGAHDRYVECGERNLSQQGLDSSSAKLLPTGTVLLSTRAPIGYVAIAKTPISTNQGFRGLVVRDGLFPEYLYYWLNLNTEELERHSSGSTFRELSASSLRLIQLLLPPIPEQRAIVQILGTLDDKIELNRRMNETLEAMARAIFQDWFVDFGPIRAKTEEREPYLPAEIWNLFPNKLDNEGKPVGWKTRPLEDFFGIVGGGTPKTSVLEYWDGEIPWFSVVDTPPKCSMFVFETKKNITNRGLAESSARLIPTGTTIISARGTVGNLAIAATEMTFNQSCYALKPTNQTGEFFVYLVAQHMVDQLQSMAHGTVFSTITRQTFEAITLAMPSPSTLAEFERQVRTYFQRIRANVLETHRLQQTRDILLPKLMSGQIRLHEAEQAIKSVA